MFRLKALFYYPPYEARKSNTMANPLKILTVLTASQAVKMEQGVDVNSQKITNVANATVSTDAVAYGQLTSVSGAIKSYVDAQNDAQDAAADAVSGAMKTYIDAGDAGVQANLDAVSGALKTYVDAENAAQDAAVDSLSGSFKSYVDAADGVLQGNLDAVSGAMKSYVDAQNTAQDGAVTAMSGAMKTYIDAGDAEVQGNLDAVSGALKSYIDAENGAQDAATDALSSSLKSYVDAADAALSQDILDASSSLKTYIDSLDNGQNAAVDALSSSLKTYIDAENTAQDVATDALSSSLKSYIDAENTAQDAAVDALSGALETAMLAEATARANGDTTLQTNLNTVSGALKVYVDTQDNAFSSSMASYVDAQDNALSGAFDTRITTLSGAAATAISNEAAARAAEDLTFLKLDGSRSMAGALNMGGFDIVSAKSGSFSGDVTVGGNLQVNGTLTYINSTNLEVTDALVTVAKGAADAAAANGAGIEVDGAGATLTYEAAGDNWSSNKDFNVEGDLYLDGYKVLDVTSSQPGQTGVELQYNGYGSVGISNFPSGDGVIISGSEVVGIGGPLFVVSSSAKLMEDLKLSGSADFTNIASVTRDGEGLYDVDAAIHALDLALGQQGSDISSAYDALRVVVTGTLSSGTVTVNLTSVGGAQFAVAEIHNIALDVMVDADATGYTNDLVAIKMFVDGAALKVQIDAPATPSAAFRLIAVNEADGKL